MAKEIVQVGLIYLLLHFYKEIFDGTCKSKRTLIAFKNITLSKPSILV